MRASSAPHSVSARSGGYSVVTIHILSACIIGASVSNVSIPDVPVVPCCPQSSPRPTCCPRLSPIVSSCPGCPRSFPVVPVVPSQPLLFCVPGHPRSSPFIPRCVGRPWPFGKCMHHRRLTWFRRAAGDIRCYYPHCISACIIGASLGFGT